MMRILVAGQDAGERRLLRAQLSGAGYAVVEAGTGRAALDLARAERFDLLLLDLFLPDIDGITICRAVRAGGPNQVSPLVMLTARGSEADTVLGLESGADDSLARPVTARELMARLMAVTRRYRECRVVSSDEGPRARLVVPPDLHIDLERRELRVREALIELTPQEFDLVALLASHRGIVFSRAALVARVWGGADEITERTVDAVVSRVRRKIERDPQRPRLLLTAWGAGYKCSDRHDEPH